MSKGHHMQARSTDRGTRRFLTPAVLLVCGFLLASAGAAFGFWSATASGSANAKATTLGAGNQPSATVSGRDVSLSWGSFTNATSYTVARSNVSPQTLSTTEHGTCASAVAAPGVSCTDTGVVENGTAATNWTYADTPSVQNWVGGASPASATVTIPGPTLSVASSSVTTAGGTATNVTVANYFDNEAVTYCVDNDSTTCPAADKTTPATATVPSTGGTVTTSSLAIPSGLTAGPHTLFAKGSLGSDPTGVSFTVTSAGTAPTVTSAASTTFTAGTAGSFTVTTTGSPTPALTNARFAGCTTTTTAGVTFHDNGNGTATIASTTGSLASQTTFCLTASNGISPNAIQTFTLTILGPVNKLVLAAQNTTTTAGVADNLTITAEDSGGNTVPTYTGTKNLTFTGANVAPNGTTHPTVTNSSGTAVNFGSTTAITFTNGLAQVSGSNNGVMTLFKAETALIKVSDGTINNGTGLSVSVAGAGPASLTLANCVVQGSSHACNGSYALGNGGNMAANVQALDTWGNGATISSAINMSVVSASPSTYSISAGSTLTINGTATPPNQSTSTFTVQKSGNANNSTTITVHVTSGPPLPDLTFTVTK